MKTAIVILNYNTVDYFDKFLPRVIQTCEGIADVIVADNASSDNSVSHVKSHYPQVKVLCSNQNYGFAGGYNFFLKGLEYEYIVLLNTDVEVTDNWLQPMLQLIEQNKQVAAVQPKILSHNNKSDFEFAGAAGGFIDKYGFPFCCGRIFETVETDHGQYDKNREIFWATGACMLIRKKLFDQLGGFDQDFFAHMEEIDLCWRMQNAGYQIYYCSASTVYHVGGGTLAVGTPHKTYLNFRNNLLMLHKNLPANKLVTTLLIKMIFDGIAAIMFLVRNGPTHFAAVFNAHIYFYKHCNRRKGIRAEAQRLIKTNNTKNIFPGSVVFHYYLKKQRVFNALKW
ncbi:MAG: glycosyltransferase family 2 protein [Bacteroidetes bacterium]|nr:glycosyltransferase family 2 protein [Bacteroidota bacterium]